MSHPKRILVLGHGELGRPILLNLISHSEGANSQISLLVRYESLQSTEPHKKAILEEYTAKGISLVPGNISDDSVEDLSTTFGQYDVVIGASGMNYVGGIQLKLCNAVLAAKVPLYIPWQFGVDYDLIGKGSVQEVFEEQLKVRELLRNQDQTQWLIVSTGMFMSFLFDRSFGVVDLEQSIVRGLASWENSVTVTAVEDIGRVVAKIVYTVPGPQGIIYTAGQTIRYGQLADILEHVLGKQVQRVLWDSNNLEYCLSQDPKNGLKKYRVAFGEGIGVSWPEESTYSFKEGMKLINVETWLRNWLATQQT